MRRGARGGSRALGVRGGARERRKGELLIDDPCWPGSPLL